MTDSRTPIKLLRTDSRTPDGFPDTHQIAYGRIPGHPSNRLPDPPPRQEPSHLQALESSVTTTDG